ncbi:Uncharacterised protein [Salmonella enterica subsp. enterica]|uniref:Uncharacterized protein n=1 Tax=Salmonella enterica I TaxID=59201 RepID=A0A379WJ24_SALET|nr:Uncharacterised protein [Salmonella enterica subsp. enterica]
MFGQSLLRKSSGKLTHAIPALLAEPVGSNLPCDDCHPNNVTTRALSRGNRHVHV